MFCRKIVIKHLDRTGGPGVAPVLHQAAQFVGGAAIGPGLGGLVHLFGQNHCRARRQLRPDLVDFLKPDGYAATCGKRFNAKTLAVNPDTVAGFAAQTIHGVGIVQGIGNTAVFLEIQPAGNFIFHKVDAFGRTQIVERLLVAGQLACGAGKGVFELEGAFFLKKHEGLALFVHSHQMRRKPLIVQRGLPFFGLRQMWSCEGTTNAKGHQQPQGHASDKAIGQTTDHGPDNGTGRRTHQALRQCHLGQGARVGGDLNAQGPPIPHG